MNEARVFVLAAQLAVEVTATFACISGNKHGVLGCQFLLQSLKDLILTVEQGDQKPSRNARGGSSW